MRLIYLVRAAQLLLTLNGLFLLYSVGNFCQKTPLSMQDCPNMPHRPPFVRPELMEEHLHTKAHRSASNRAVTAKIASDASTTAPTTTAHAPSTTESSTVTPSTTTKAPLSTTEEAKIRVKRDEARELPGNGVSEGQHKIGVAAAQTKKEEGKKEGDQKSTTTVKAEAKVDEKKEEKKEAVTSPVPVHHEEKKEEQKSEHPEVKTEDKKEDKKEEKKGQDEDKKKPEHPTDEKTKEEKIVVKKEESVSNTTETPVTTTEESKKAKKESLGAKVDFPVAVEAHHHDANLAESKADHAPSSTSSDEGHHTVNKELKAHVQEPVKIEEKIEKLPPQLSQENEKYVLEHSGAFLEEVRCLEVTSDAYFGREKSPFGAHLKGLVFVGPVLVVIAVYLVCTLLRSMLSKEEPIEFADKLGCAFHCGMWLFVLISMYFIHDHWLANWDTVSASTFKPDFPCKWFALMVQAGFMMLATALETWFLKRLHYDIVVERAYRRYEVIDNSEPEPNQGHFAKLESPRIF